MPDKQTRLTTLKNGLALLCMGSIRRSAATVALTAALPAVGIVLFVGLANQGHLLSDVGFDALLLLLTVCLALTAAWALGNRLLGQPIRQELEAREQHRENVNRIILHNLKSPLINLIHLSDMLLNDPNIIGKQREHAVMIDDVCRRMTRAVDTSQALYQMEDRAYQNAMASFDLAGAVHLAIQETAPDARKRQVDITVLLDGRPLDQNASFPLRGEENLCVIMLGNLIKNAVEASRSGETVLVNLDGRARSLVIRNRGEVPRSIRDRFFEKYVTAGKKDGTGLGAYCARLIATVLGWNIRLDTSVAGETSVEIRFPSEAVFPQEVLGNG